MIFKILVAFVFLNAFIPTEANVVPEPEAKNDSNSSPDSGKSEIEKALVGLQSLCNCLGGNNSLECNNLKPLLADAKFYNIIEEYCGKVNKSVDGNAFSLVVDSDNSSVTGYPSTSESPGNTTSDHMTSDIDLSASESPSNATRSSRDDKSFDNPTNGSRTAVELPRDGISTDMPSNGTSASNFSKADKPRENVDETKNNKKTNRPCFFSDYFYLSAAIVMVVISAIAGYILGLVSRKKNIPPPNVNGLDAVPEPTFKMQFYRRDSYSFE